MSVSSETNSTRLLPDTAQGERLVHTRLIIVALALTRILGCGDGPSMSPEEQAVQHHQQAQQQLAQLEAKAERNKVIGVYSLIATNFVFIEQDHYKVVKDYHRPFVDEIRSFEDPAALLEKFDLRTQKLVLYGLETGDTQLYQLCAVWDDAETTQAVLSYDECRSK